VEMDCVYLKLSINQVDFLDMKNHGKAFLCKLKSSSFYNPNLERPRS